ncbi:MAG: DLW-39 family protein [Actinomycetota bacterium]
MKKPVLLVAVAAGLLAVLRKRRSTQVDAELWREATAEDRK